MAKASDLGWRWRPVLGSIYRSILRYPCLSMKTDLEITPDELLPKPPRVLDVLPSPKNELEELITELRRINDSVNSLIPRVRTALNYYVDDASNVRMRDILNITANYFEFNETALLSVRRDRRTVRARQIAMFLCKELTPRSYAEIALFFRDRDHSTVMHAVSLIEELKAKDTFIATAVANISNRIKEKRND